MVVSNSNFDPHQSARIMPAILAYKGIISDCWQEGLQYMSNYI